MEVFICVLSASGNGKITIRNMVNYLKFYKDTFFQNISRCIDVCVSSTLDQSSFLLFSFHKIYIHIGQINR